MIKRFGFSLIEAKDILEIMPLTSVFCIPIYSIIAMKYGFKTVILLAGTMLGTLSYWIMSGLSEDKPAGIHLPVIMLGQFFSIHGAVAFASISMSCTKRAVAIGFGICLCLCNLNAAIIPYFIGNIIKNDTAEEYQQALLFLIKLGFAGSIFGLFLVF